MVYRLWQCLTIKTISFALCIFFVYATELHTYFQLWHSIKIEIVYRFVRRFWCRQNIYFETGSISNVQLHNLRMSLIEYEDCRIRICSDEREAL